MTAVGAPREFLERVASAEPTDECVSWPFATSRGYGIVRDWRPVALGTPNRKAHQVAWELLRDLPFPMGMHARHLCGNGHLGCVNPIHVTPGTAKQNADDEERSGRMVRWGEAGSNARLTWDAVDDIRLRLAAGESITSIARVYGVARDTVGHVSRGQTWKPEHDPRCNGGES